jgi:transglutaminase-like putative cysteine protease
MMISRVWNWLSLENPYRGWLLGGLLLVLVGLAADAAQSLSGAEQGSLGAVLLVGAGTAWVLGQGRWPATRAWALYASAGVGALAVLTARVLGAAFGLLNETFSIYFAWLTGNPATFDALVGHLLEIQARMSGLLARVWPWLAAFAQGRALDDPLVGELAWLVAGWLLAGWAGWRLARRSDVLAAFMPVLAVQAVILATYRPRDVGWLWFNLLIFVSLLGLAHFERRLRAWLDSGLDYSESAIVNSVVGVLALALLLTGLAGLTPSVSVDEVRRAWEERRRAQAGEPGTAGTPMPVAGGQASFPGNRITAGLPRDHLLRGEVEISQTLVMRVQTYDFAPAPRPDLRLDAPRYYWRAYTYDFYSGQGWASSPVETAFYPANEVLALEKPEYYRRVAHDFDILNAGDESLIFRVGLLESVDTPIQAEWRNVLVRLTLPGAPNGSADLYRAVGETNTYRATSLMATVDVETLRGIWPEYPEWVRTRYLALPPVPDRVTNLARDITAAAPTLYDRAEAIERYLRQNYDYTLDVPTPPRDRDPVDYFLFDLGEGYCDYYASAMVVLARSVGIPARLVVGYVGGTYDPAQATYTVREENAHSWVEVYFPGIGWVEFEPTPAQPGFQRIGTGAAPLPYIPPERTPPNPWSGLMGWLTGLPAILPWAGLAILTILLGLGLFRFVRDWRTPHNTLAMRKIGRIYQSMRRRAAKRLGAPLPNSLTPQELAAALRKHLEESETQTRKAFSQEDVTQIADLYQRATFSEHAPDKKDARLAVKAWRRLWWRL